MRQGQDGKTDDNSYRRIIHGPADGTVGTVHSGDIIIINSEFPAEAVNIVNGVIDADTDSDRGDSDSHHIQWNARQAHATENNGRRQNIGYDSD